MVTGAAGFIGSHLAEELLAAGHEVVGVDSFTDYYERSRKERNAASLDVLEADLAVAPLEPILAGADGVFHLAGQPGVRASWGETLPALPRPERARHAACLRGRRGSRRPRRLRVVVVRLRRRRDLSHRGGRRPAADLPVRDHEARLRAPRRRDRARARPRRGRAAVLHGLRPAAAARHGVHRDARGARTGRDLPALRRRQRGAKLHVRGRRRERARSRRWSAAARARSTTSAAATRRR